MTELTNSDLFRVNDAGDRFEEAWNRGHSPRIEDFLVPHEGTLRRVLLQHLLGIEIELLWKAGKEPRPDEYNLRFPNDRSIVSAVFEDRAERSEEKTLTRHVAPTLHDLDGFKFLRLLGAGTFGEVWLAEDLNLGRRLVAIKALKPRSRASDDERGRSLEILRHEAGLLVSVRHRNVNQVFSWVQKDRDHFLVLNYVAGGSLADRLKLEGMLGWPEAARYVADVGEGLMAVHERGIIHRDIKPSNILWDPETDEALLTDFGVSARLGDTVGLGGTLPFMAPEAFEGKVSPALDVYSLAATLFQLITGKVPFAGPDVSDFQEQIARGLPDPDLRCKGMPEPLERVIRAGLAAEPAHRPDVAAFLATLRGALNQLMADSLTSAPATTEPLPDTSKQARLPSTESVPPVHAGPVDLRLVVSRQTGPDSFSPIAATHPLPAPLTRDMKKVPPRPDQVQLRTGERVRIEVGSDRPGYLTVFNIGPTGNLNLLFPVDPGKRGSVNAILAGVPLQVREVEMTPPAGRERIFAVWSRNPLSLRLDQLESLIQGRVDDSGVSRPYVATRDMKLVQQAVWRLAPDDWHAVALELEHRS
jgi:serine/threonine protein kinase